MNNILFEKTANIIVGLGGGHFSGPKSDKLIDKAQETLGVNFPNSYKEFLREYGCGSVEGIEIYGLIDGDFLNSGVPDAVWVTLQERKLGLPNNLVIVYSTGYGPVFALDTAKFDDIGECPVVSYVGVSECEKVADSFAEFLLSELKTIE